MSSKSLSIFSIIVPTRGRPDGLRRLLDSFKATTTDIDALELILVVDADDTPTLDFTYDGVPLKRVVVQPGLKMGELNMAGYEAATGDYIMLLNDDVIVQTRGWDERVLAAFRSFQDRIVLVHVNDKIFEEKLCTFPFLSKTYCRLAGGICPTEYQRYRIDDHIYNVFNLLAVMGKTRILYLPEIVFEHTNYVLTKFGGAEYRPDERIHGIDTKRFDELLPERKKLALRLMEHIDGEAARDKRRIRQDLLEPIADSIALRRPEYVRVWLDSKPLSNDNTRVTIGIVSANLRSDHARTCIDLVKKFTKNFDLIVLDNNEGSNFNHPHEMNKLLSVCDTDYLVLMDDDVFVEPGWLDGMIRCITPAVGVVTPLHKDRDGMISYAGVVMRPDWSGHHSHSFAVPEGPARIQTLCSAIMLIDMAKCGHLRFNESYSKYFLDIDYGLQVWSAGYEVVCSPYVSVTHIGGATLQQGTARSNDLFELQRQHFVREWADTGRYRELARGIWSKVPEIEALAGIPAQVNALLNQRFTDREVFKDRALKLFRFVHQSPALADWASQRVWGALGGNRPPIDDPERGHLGFLLGCTSDPVILEKEFQGLTIVLYKAEFFAIPHSEGRFDYARICKGTYSQIYRSESLDVLKARIRGGISDLKVTTTRQSKPVGGFVESWRLFNSERSRFGSRQRALKVLGKTIVKKQIIAVFGVRGFLGLKDIYWQAKAEKVRRGVVAAFWVGAKLLSQRGTTVFWNQRQRSDLAFRDGIQKKVKLTSLQRANPQRWLDACPVVMIEEDYRDHSIYRFEYKYFALPRAAGPFDYETYKQGKYNSCLITHTFSEARSAVDKLLDDQRTSGGGRNLVFACLPPSKLNPILETCPPESTALLVEQSSATSWANYETITANGRTIFEWARRHNSNGSDPLDRRLASENFDSVTVPWSFPETWADNSLEAAAAKISGCVAVVHSSGARRIYEGENLHRLVYNKSYLASMFQVLPEPQGKVVLEAGCSDGLVCDMLALAGAAKVVGIDVMKTVGCSFPHPRVEYQAMDICQMSFPDQMFDVVYSIATFEHLADPYGALLEILRVTKVGGYAYIQAGPLYYSPFGHHMFKYFQDYPWIHLRKSRDEIISYAREQGIDRSIQNDLSTNCEQYVAGMLNVDHVNGLLLNEYRLEEFRTRNDIEVLKFNISYEGRDLLTPDIVAEIPGLDVERLVEHGFEIAFRRIT
jgi:GT2 family glycosyltransferase/SAM-dependent methyltransferase